MRSCFSCVGLVVFLGCLMMVIAPDPKIPGYVPDPNTTSVIVLDPGHGGHDGGARGRNGILEKNLALDIATRVEALLKQSQYTVILTRHTDQFVRLSERALIGNQTDNSLFVSIHLNESPSSQATGVETYFTDSKELPSPAWSWIGVFSKPSPLADADSQVLASLIQDSLAQRIEGSNRGVRSRAFYVVRNVRRPAVLVECGFISNPLEAQLLTNAEYRDRIASGIVDGILSYDRQRLKSEKVFDVAKK